MKGLKKSSAYNCLVRTLDNDVKLACPVVSRCATNKMKFPPNNPKALSVTPIKEIYQCEGFQMNAINRLDFVMNQFNQAIYEINMAYNECKLLRSVLVASEESIPPLHKNSLEDISDVTTYICVEEISGTTEEMLRVPETEVDIQSFTFCSFDKT